MKQTKRNDRKLHLDTTQIRSLTPEQLVAAPGGILTWTAATCWGPGRNGCGGH